MEICHCSCKPCICINCPRGFEKIIELKKIRVVIYRHSGKSEHKNNSHGIGASGAKSSDVFVFHNTNDKPIKGQEILSELENEEQTGPRYRRVQNHVVKLLQNVQAINGNNVLSICDHCQPWDRRCSNCEDIKIKFYIRKNEPKGTTKQQGRDWIAEVKRLLQESFPEEEKPEAKRLKTRSELRFDELLHRKFARERRPDFRDFHHESDSILKLPKITDKSKAKATTAEDSNIFVRSTQSIPQIRDHYGLDTGVGSRPRYNVLDHETKFDLKGERKPEDEQFKKTATPEDIFLRSTQIRDHHGFGTGATSRFRHVPLDEERELREFDYVKRTTHDQYVGDKESIKEITATDYGQGLQRKWKPEHEQHKKATTSEDNLILFGKIKLTQTISQISDHDGLGILGSGRSRHSGLDDERKSDYVKLTTKVQYIDDGKSSEEIIPPGYGKDFTRSEKSENEQLNVLDIETKIALDDKFNDDQYVERNKKNLSQIFKSPSFERDIWDSKQRDKQRLLDIKKDSKSNQKVTRDSEHDVNVIKENITKAANDMLQEIIEKNSSLGGENKLQGITKKQSMEKVEDEMGKIEQGKIEKSIIEQGKNDQSKIKQGEIGQGKTNQSKIKQGEKGQGKTDQSKIKQGEIEKGKGNLQQNEIEGNKTHSKESSKSQLASISSETTKNENNVEKTTSKKQLAKEEDLLKAEQSKQLEQTEKLTVKEKETASEKQYKKDALSKLKRKINLKTSESHDTNRTELQSPVSPKAPSKPEDVKVNMKKIAVRKRSQDNAILQLVKFSSRRPEREHKKEKVPRKQVKHHFKIRSISNSPDAIKKETCLLCINSDSQLDIECKKGESNSVPNTIIWGQNIYKYNPAFIENNKEQAVKPFFWQNFVECLPDTEISVPSASRPLAKPEYIGGDLPGITRYALSDKTFIDKGWTMLPTVKVVRKINVYRMHPSHPEFNWFERNKDKGLMHYDTGEELAQFDKNGRGRWYYKNGRLALDYYDATESNTQKRFVIYSNGEPDGRGKSRPHTVLATFDYLGNGVVFDHSGKIRLKFNQTEGAVLDSHIGPQSRWKWHTLNDPPVLQQVMYNTQMIHKDPTILESGGDPPSQREVNEDMVAIEYDNSIKEKCKKLTKPFKPFQIKMKALKINENFSLKVLDQATIYLIFRDGMNHFKWNIGMILDHREIIDTETADVEEVSNTLENFPACTDSVAVLQKSVAQAQRFEKARTQREGRLRPREPCASADRLTAAASRPLRLPLRPLNTCMTPLRPHLCCKSTKRSSSNVCHRHRVTN